MDSIMSAEIKQILERELEIFLSSQDIKSLSLNKLQYLVKVKADNNKICESYEEYKNFFKSLKRLLDHTGNEVSLKKTTDSINNTNEIFILPRLEGKLKTMLYYSPKFPKLKSRVKLIKPKDIAFFDPSKDYGLSSLFEKVEEVEEYEGGHFSVIENPEIPRAVNEFIGDDEDIAQ